MFVYTVASYRQYEDGEHYFGADIVTNTLSQALDYVKSDAAETAKQFDGLFDVSYEGSDIHDEENFNCWMMSYKQDSHEFTWFVDKMPVLEREKE